MQDHLNFNKKICDFIIFIIIYLFIFVCKNLYQVQFWWSKEV